MKKSSLTEALSLLKEQKITILEEYRLLGGKQKSTTITVVLLFGGQVVIAFELF
jgi:hypothetical protein